MSKSLRGPGLSVLLLAASLTASAQQESESTPDTARASAPGGSYVGIGLGTPSMVRSNLIMPSVPDGAGSQLLWNNSYRNLGNYPLAFIGELSYRPGRRALYSLGCSYAPTKIRSGLFWPQNTRISKLRGNAKFLWSPHPFDRPVRINIGTTYDLERDWISASYGTTPQHFNQLAWVHSLNAVAGLSYGNAKVRCAIEAEMLLISRTVGQWSQFLYSPGGAVIGQWNGDYGETLDALEAIASNYFLRSISVRLCLRVPQKG